MHYSWYNSWGFSYPHMWMSQHPVPATPTCLSSSFQYSNSRLDLVCTSCCNSSLNYKHPTLQLLSIITTVHLLQYPNSKNDHTPLESKSIDPIASLSSYPWSYTLLQIPGNSLSLVLLHWTDLAKPPSKLNQTLYVFHTCSPKPASNEKSITTIIPTPSGS